MGITILKNTILAVMVVSLFSCSTIPKGVRAVSPFDKDRYLGKWYEIARFDFIFERGLNNTTAEYSLTKRNIIKVVNRGYNGEKKIWKQAVGKAKFVSDESIAMLKVSFFGPFYSRYNVIAIDDNYKYALVSGRSLDYLWILSRENSIPEDVKYEYLRIAEEIGFNTFNLLWIEHDK